MKGLVDKPVSKVFANGCYCYGLVEETNELYSWGIGYNYVLGTREDDNSYEPVLVNPKQFHEKRVKLIGPGTQHVVILSTDSTEPSSLPTFDESVLELSDAILDDPVLQKEEENNIEKFNPENSDK